MLLLDYKKGVAPKQTIKQGFCFCCHPLLEGMRREKRRERLEVKKHHFYTKNGALKTGIPPFWAPNLHFFKSAKAPIFKAFPGKAGGSYFLGKGYVRKRANNKNKMITFWGVFQFDAFLSCVSGF